MVQKASCRHIRGSCGHYLGVVVARVLGAAAVLALLGTGCIEGGPTIGPDYPWDSVVPPTKTPMLTMSWPEPRKYSEDWDLDLDWEAHRKACPDDGDDFSVKTFERSPGQVIVTFRCDDGSSIPVRVILRPQDSI
jgi:hypothetical protein